jgi:methionyl-tRNA formyltransferase
VLSLSARPETVEAAPGTIVLAAPGQALLVACGAGQVAQLDMVALDEGYFTGGQLAGLGLQVGEMLLPLAESVQVAPA